MRIIEDLKKDKVYARVLAKFNDDGPFTFGNDYNTTIYCYDEGESIPMDYRALGKYIDAIRYNKGYQGIVKDNNGMKIIFFHRDDKFYDRNAEVTMINESIIRNYNSKPQETPKKLLKK